MKEMKNKKIVIVAAVGITAVASLIYAVYAKRNKENTQSFVQAAGSSEYIAIQENRRHRD